MRSTLTHITENCFGIIRNRFPISQIHFSQTLGYGTMDFAKLSRALFWFVGERILSRLVRFSFLGLSQGGTLAPNQAETNCGGFCFGLS